MKYISCAAEDTRDFAERLAGDLRGGEIILLKGGLGCGKTVFAKGIARGLGVSDVITSPTFVIFNVYQGERLSLCHCDAYRLSGADDAESTGLSDFLGRKDTVCVVEWPENADLHFPTNVINVEITYLDENTREIVVAQSAC